MYRLAIVVTLLFVMYGGYAQRIGYVRTRPLHYKSYYVFTTDGQYRKVYINNYRPIRRR